MISIYLAFCGLAWSLSRSWVPVAIAVGLVATQIASHLPDQVVFPAYATIWVSIGGAAISRGSILAGLLLIASGLCYLWADMIGVAPVAGVAPMIAADVLGLLALIASGVAGGNSGGTSKRSGVGFDPDRCRFLVADRKGGVAAKESAR